MKFEFATAGKILFGPGRAKEAGERAAQLGRHAFFVHGFAQEHEAVRSVLSSFDGADIQYKPFQVQGEPSVEVVRHGAAEALGAGCDFVVGLGGGSAIDTGKAIAALITNPGDVMDFLEVVGKGLPLVADPVPMMAIPTTSGTGAEVTRNAVLGVPDHKVKVSLRSEKMLPDIAIIDPELTYGLPPEVTASTGMDALTQLIEPYVSNQSNPMTDSLCREGMIRAAESLQRAYDRGDDAQARQNMSIASLFGGLALANAKLGAVHGFAGSIGGMFSAPHGAICACLLPYVMEINIRVLQAQTPESSTLDRYREIGQLLTGDPEASAAQGVSWVEALVKALRIPGLSSYGITRHDFPQIIAKAAESSSMKGNPVRLLEDEMAEILALAM